VTDRHEPGDERGTEAGLDTRVVAAPAKLNLFLRVLGRRADRYHELDTVVLPISLADSLTVHAFADPGSFRTLSVSLHVTGDPSIAAGVPRDETNLALRAALSLAAATGSRGFAEITLDKRVPAAAGLGGGSADAAATLLALNDLWGTGLGAAELAAVGASVGSDVPALLAGGPVRARGRGEVVEPASVAPLRWVVVTPPFGIRTPDAFRWWDDDGGLTGPDPASLVRAAANGRPEAIGPLLFNDLEDPVLRRHPTLRHTRERLLRSGAVGAVLCGSGPTMAGLLAGDAVVPALPGAVLVTSEGR